VRVRGATRTSTGKPLSARTIYVVRRSGGRLSIRSSSGNRVGVFRSGVKLYRRGGAVRLLGRAINGVRSGRYRGAIQLRRGGGGGVSAVNSLPIDSYIRGVVPGEMPSSWAIEALKAQAVAARTYALATRKRGGAFDLYPDTRSQVYRGRTAELPRTNAAVQATKRQIVTYGGDPITAYYFSTSGGRTENVENSFLSADPQPYLKSVKDPYDGISPKHRWRKRFSAGTLGDRLGARGSLRKIKVLVRGKSPRIIRARVYGSDGNRILTGPQIRRRLALYDSWAYFTRVSTAQAHGARASSGPAFPVIEGVFDPAPRSRRVLVERRRAGGWSRVAELHVSHGGRYSTTVATRGTYRVRAGAAIGPAVRVR
jgi:stage II sporulation protein D